MGRRYRRRHLGGRWTAIFLSGLLCFVVAGSLPAQGAGSGVSVTSFGAASGPALSVSSFGAANSTLSLTQQAIPITATATGDLLVATIRTRTTSGAPATVSTVTDSANNKWLPAVQFPSGSQNDEEIWYAPGAAGLSTSGAVTVTVSASAAIAVTVLDVAGTSSASLDVIAHNSGSSTGASTGTTPTTATAYELAVADIGWSAAVTTSSPTAGYAPTALEQSSVSGDKAGEQAAWQETRHHRDGELCGHPERFLRLDGSDRDL